MEIVLTQEVDRLGTVGQKVHVKDGYARNFLIPRGLAVSANARTVAQARTLQTARLRVVQLEREKALRLAQQLQERAWVIPVSVGEQGKLHGAVTAGDLAGLLKKEGLSVEKHQVDLERPLAQLGEFQVPLKLHAEVKIILKVQLVPR